MSCGAKRECTLVNYYNSTKALGRLSIEVESVCSRLKQIDLKKAFSSPTKRNLVKTIATLFDTVGYLAPYSIRAKGMMQEMWIAVLQYDELYQRELIHKSVVDGSASWENRRLLKFPGAYNLA